METFITSANRGSISTGYDIDNSVKLEPDNSEYLKSNNTHSGTTPTSNQIGTVSFWIKRTEIGNDVSGKQMYIFAAANSARYSNLGFDEFDNLTIFSGDSSWNSVSPYTYNKFRDTSAWYHIVIRYDSTDGTASNRVRVYSNGTEVSWVVAPNITQNGVMTWGAFGSPTWHSWGTIYSYYTAQKFFGGYLAEAHFVDGQSLAPTEFAEYDDNGIWKPKAYGGTYGNCGYYLDFADSGNLGDDESGNGFDFDENNIAAADQATDTPTNNFAIANPLLTVGGFMNPTEGGTKGVLSTSGPGNNTGGTSLVSTIPVSKGKWYFEAQNTNSGDVYLYLGVGDTGSINLWGIDGVKMTNQTTSTVAWRGGGANDGKVYGRSAGTNYTDTNPVTWETEVVGLALDLDNEKIYFHKSGTWINSGDPASGTDNDGQYDLVTGVDDQWLIAVSAYNLATWHVNFGGYTTMTISSAATDANGYGTFEYAPPSGFYALCTKNLAEYG